jgi:hypothetical protein
MNDWGDGGRRRDRAPAASVGRGPTTGTATRCAKLVEGNKKAAEDHLAEVTVRKAKGAYCAPNAQTLNDYLPRVDRRFSSERHPKTGTCWRPRRESNARPAA